MQIRSSLVIRCSFLWLALEGIAFANDTGAVPAGSERPLQNNYLPVGESNSRANGPESSVLAPYESPPPIENEYEQYESNGRVLRYQLKPPAVEPTETEHAAGSAAAAADDGLLMPYTVSPRIRAGRSWVRAVSGYNSAASAMRARVAAESAATRWLAIRVEYEHGPSTGTNDRLNFGGRIQLLSQRKYGLDLGLIAFYQPRDFRAEGNIVSGLSLGRTEGRFGLFGAALVGSDPEGDDQTTDGRLSFVYRTNDSLQLGLDSRFEYVLSTDAKRFGTTTTDWELAIEPTAVISIGPLALLMEAGLSALQTTGPYGFATQQRHVHTGAIAMAGASSVF